MKPCLSEESGVLYFKKNQRKTRDTSRIFYIELRKSAGHIGNFNRTIAYEFYILTDDEIRK